MRFLFHRNWEGFSEAFFRLTPYNTNAHNTHTHSPLWIHVRKPYPMSTSGGLSTTNLEILEVTTGVSSSTGTSYNAGKSRNKFRKMCEYQVFEGIFFHMAWQCHRFIFYLTEDTHASGTVRFGKTLAIAVLHSSASHVPASRVSVRAPISIHCINETSNPNPAPLLSTL
jgi:hypothetical protein